MKRKLQSICVVLAALSCIVFTFCTKEEQPESQEKPKTVQIKFTAQIDEFHSETKADVVKAARIVWEGGERVYVYEGSNYLGYIEAPLTISDNKVAELIGTITTPASENTTLTFVYSNLFTGQPTVSDNKITVDMSTQTTSLPFVIYGSAEYTSAGISKPTVPFKFATSAVMVSVTKLEPSVAISKTVLVGVNTKCVLTLGASGNVTVDGTNQSFITRTEASKSASANGYAFIEMGVPKSSANADRTVTVYQKSIHSAKALASEIDESKCVNSIAELQANTLGGLFTVDESGAKVRFSRANMYCNTTTTPVTYLFEDRQYYYRNLSGMTDDEAYLDGIFETPQGTVGSFFWSPDAAVAYAFEYPYPSTTPEDVLFTNDPQNQRKPNSGFTVAEQTNIWRSLSAGEWKYLLNERSTKTTGVSSNARFAKINVDGIRGVLIFPDDFTWTSAMGSAPTNCNNGASSGWSIYDNYSLEQFVAMESAGCVFLPRAHMRVKFYFYNESCYLSSSPYNDCDYVLLFDAEYLKESTDVPRYYGGSVRLVSCDK